MFLSPLGRHEEAIAEMKRAMELEPLSITQGANFAAVYLYARQFDKALDQARKTYELDPTQPSARHWMCHSYNINGMYEDSLGISEKVGETSTALYSVQAYAYARSGRREQAETILKKWKEVEKARYISHYQMAIAYIGLGEKDLAFAELERAYKEHDWFLVRIKVDPFMDPLRDDPRFNQLVKRVGLE